MKTDFAKLVREIMIENGLSQRGVTAAADVNRSTFRRFLEGGNTIDMDKLERILAVMGYELDIVRIGDPSVRPSLSPSEPAVASEPAKRLIRLACMEMSF
ncbi:helix-turn-helix domain-containing protein [Agrobacterium sp. rho-13.3]|uniref:helix-turn-helix domain-containing protein n=1 Tax=Agrobacterium sp. rho-13.3 TaxID=3072980 RepID=UPI002A0E5445|nr:helix-turn-helix transcriptional regulator [Agrobacterium sp. rho-13.3]MDX8309401.1 helix-turn-helix transcriptional regulator [Agrobacterium sp. rho-13.3]